MKEEIEVHKDMISGKTEVKKVYGIYAERDSVCMGDDVTAPHAKKIYCEKEEKISDFFKKLMNSYLNVVNDWKWEIIAGNKVLGYINYSAEGNATYELSVPDERILDLKIEEIYCKKRGE